MSMIVIVVVAILAFNSVICADLSNNPGHLKPLGESGPMSDIDSYDGFPSLKTFFHEYVHKSRPVLMKGAAKSFPSYQKWSDDYLLSLPETAKIQVYIERRKKENRVNDGVYASFKQFLQRYNKTDEYLIANVPDYLKDDVYLPSCLNCKAITYVDQVMWFSSGGTKSVLHNDDVDNINCLMAGKKELIMIDRTYEAKVPLDREGGYSSLDVDSVDLNKYPGLADVKFRMGRMEAGDCLFIPYFWYHCVRSYDRNIAVNVWFEHSEKGVDVSSCEDVKELGPTLSKFVFLTEESEKKSSEDSTDQTDKTEGTDAEGNDAASFRSYLADAMRDVKKLSLTEFISFIKEDTDNWNFEQNNVDADAIITQVFHEIDENKDGHITIDEVKKLTDLQDNNLEEMVGPITVTESSDGAPDSYVEEEVDDYSARDEL